MHAQSDYAYLDVVEGQADRLVWKASARGRHTVGTTPVLELHNDSPQPQRFVLEAARWSDHALRPGQLFSLQEYRDLFTDIVGSTAMYAERGDPAAFMTVKNHFGEVFPVVARLEDVTFSSKALRAPLPVKRWTCFSE